jgi:LacI family transcriptional regulator
MATMRDVAKRAGVSVATVSHVINGTRKVAPETMRRIKGVMEELDYHPNAVAQSLRTRRTHAIGAVVSDITNPFFATLVRGAEDTAIETGYSLIVCNSDENPEKEDRYVRLLRRRRMDGLLISPVGDGSSKAVQELPRSRMPFVFIDRRAKGIQGDAVLSDNVDGAYQATRHLIEKGHKRIGIIIGVHGATTTEERLAGYRKALDEAGIPLSQELIAYGGYRQEGGRSATENFLVLPEPPSAIFSTNNLMTVGVLKILAHRKLCIPKEMALVSFDDLDLGDLFRPSLTVITQNPHAMGKIAMKALISQFGDGANDELREIRVPVKLVMRGST